MNKKLTQEDVVKLFKYDAETGLLRWRKKPWQSSTDIVGSLGRDGYLRIGIYGRTYNLHRVIWLYEYGYMPENQLDHINRQSTDNRLCNLREVSNSCQQRNKRTPKNNSSGVKGVIKTRAIWIALINVNGRTIYLGSHKSLEEAVCARLAAEQCVGWHGCDMTSPAYIFVSENIQKKKVKHPISNNEHIDHSTGKPPGTPKRTIRAPVPEKDYCEYCFNIFYECDCPVEIETL